MGRTNSAREDAPSAREYRCLKRAARDHVTHLKRDDDEFRLECELVIRLMGELGLRAGEVPHLKESWVDFDQLEITLPTYDRCEDGQDGGPCGYCKQQAQQMANKRDDISYETALRKFWRPKNEMAARTIWFGWNEDLVEILDEYLYKFGAYKHSRVSINRRVDKVASECNMVDVDDVYPHALRGHAALFHAKKGMRAYQLKEFMGWSEVDGAMDYIKLAANDVKSELKRVHQNPLRR